MPEKPSRLKTGQIYEFVCVRVVVTGRSKVADAGRVLRPARKQFRNQVSGLVASYGGEPFNWAGDGGAFLFPVTDGREFDEAVRAAFRILELLPGIHGELQPTAGPDQAPSARISLDTGPAVYDGDAGLLTGDFLDAFLKNERAISSIGAVTITDRIHRQISFPLQDRFMDSVHSAALGCWIYRSKANQAPVSEADTITSAQGPDAELRRSLVDPLSRLSPADFADLVSTIPGAESHIGRHGRVPRLAEELVHWAESPTGCGLARLRRAEQAMSSTLVDLVWSMGRKVRADYERHQAEQVCSHYLERYEQRHAQVKILGMSEPIPLASIYTEVRIVSPSFLRGYRNQEELSDSFLQNGRYLAGHDSDGRLPRSGLDVANDEGSRFLNLLGAPGAGKSTFLRYIGYMALQSNQPPPPDRGLPAAASRYRFKLVPVLLDLRNVGEKLRFLNLETLIDEELETNGFPANFGREALKEGGLLVLLDGLDEVSADMIDRTIEQVSSIVDKYPFCRYMTSCRTAFYKDFFPRFTDALLADFSDDQIQSFIENWFRSELDRRRGTGERLWDLLKSPTREPTRELARTPLLATFLCLVYDDRQQLPANRVELYGDALRILLERWSASKRVHCGPVFPGLSNKRELLMLEAIAGPSYEREQYFFTTRELEAAIEEFLQCDVDRPDKVDGRQVLEEIEWRQGLLVQRAHDKHSFSHLTIHEYLAACHYYKVGDSGQITRKTLTQARWREVHLLLAGLQEPNADGFLLEMTTEVAGQVTSEPLRRLVSWAGRTARVDPSPQRTAARRAVILGFALARARDRTHAAAWGDAWGRGIDLTRVLNLALENALELGHALDTGLDLNLALTRARDIAAIMRKHESVKPEFTNICKCSDKYFAKPAASVDRIPHEPGDARDTPTLKVPLSDSDAKQCLDLLICTRRILECRDAAERVTRAGWGRVCERILALPPDGSIRAETTSTPTVGSLPVPSTSIPATPVDAGRANVPTTAPPARTGTPPLAQPPSLDRTTLVRTLSALGPIDMAFLVTLVEGAASHVGRHGTVVEQAADLIRWAESPTGPGLGAIRKALENSR